MTFMGMVGTIVLWSVAVFSNRTATPLASRAASSMSSLPVACSGYRAWADWLDGELVLERSLCPEGDKTLVWGRITNASARVLKVRVYAYKDGELLSKCGAGTADLNLFGTLAPGATRKDWTYIGRGQGLTPCAILEH